MTFCGAFAPQTILMFSSPWESSLPACLVFLANPCLVNLAVYRRTMNMWNKHSSIPISLLGRVQAPTRGAHPIPSAHPSYRLRSAQGSMAPCSTTACTAPCSVTLSSTAGQLQHRLHWHWQKLHTHKVWPTQPQPRGPHGTHQVQGATATPRDAFPKPDLFTAGCVCRAGGEHSSCRSALPGVSWALCSFSPTLIKVCSQVSVHILNKVYGGP